MPTGSFMLSCCIVLAPLLLNLVLSARFGFASCSGGLSGFYLI
jgi:hypothetical protein